jgi:hypothetical protein
MIEVIEQPKRFASLDPHMDIRPTRAWFVEADTAINAVFPKGHPVHRSWSNGVVGAEVPVETFQFRVGIVDAALSLLRSGRLGSLVDAIRAETEGELLEQAEALLKAHRVAAAVIAGGALETHLRHLVAKNGLTITGEGSIAKYDGAIAQARNKGNEIYSANLGKHVTAWGGMRNDAAHDPGNFKWSEEDVRRMIEGVRDFIDRTTPR